MREHIVFTLFLLSAWTGATQNVPAGWKIVKGAKGSCQVAVPPDLTPYGYGTGPAVVHDATSGRTVGHSQAGQKFKPFTESQLNILDISRDKVFESSAKRLFYRDRTSRNSDQPNAYSVMTPGHGGTCSSHVV